MRGVFVTGTDTGIGKTVVSACLVKAWQARYWKPIQTGLAAEDGDTATVASLSGAAPARCHAPQVALRAPLSPEAASRREGARVELEDFYLPPGDGPLVVEGAGGIFVPLNARDLMIDLVARLDLPVLLVARSTLGTINHSLLTLAALRSRALPVLGVVCVGPANPENASDIAHHGKVRVLAALPEVARVTPDLVTAWSKHFTDIRGTAR